MAEIERNFNDVKQQLTEEMNRNLELKQRLERLQDEKNAADVRCTELKQALEEFIFSTDKRDIDEDQEDTKNLPEPVQGNINKYDSVLLYYIDLFYLEY